MKRVILSLVMFCFLASLCGVVVLAGDPQSPTCFVAINVSVEGTVFQSYQEFEWRVIWVNCCTCDDAESVVKIVVSAGESATGPWTAISQYNITPGGLDNGYPSKDTWASTEMPVWATHAKLGAYILCTHSDPLPLNDRDPATGWKEEVYEKQ